MDLWAVENAVYFDDLVDVFESYDQICHISNTLPESSTASPQQNATLPVSSTYDISNTLPESSTASPQQNATLPVSSAASPQQNANLPDSSTAGSQHNAVKSIAKSNNRKSYRKCSNIICQNTNENSKLFTFPNIRAKNSFDQEKLIRWKKWIQNCGNRQLLDIPSSMLHRNYYVCKEHFDETCYYNTFCERLLPNAVPTKFMNEPIPDDEMLNFPKLSMKDIFTGNVEYFIICVIQSNDNDDENTKFEHAFESYMRSLEVKTCRVCKESSLVSNLSKFQCSHGKNYSLYSKENNMDQGPVPCELSDLTYVEQQLISLVHTQMSVYKLKGGQQYAYSDVSTLARQLPHKLNELPSIITIRTTNDVKHVDFKVRAQKVKSALVWLKQNNKFYENIEISENNIAELPIDGNVYEHLRNIHNYNENDDGGIEQLEGGSEIFDDIYDSYVPDCKFPSQDENIKNISDWPKIGTAPINEFQTPGYIPMAFPCLFPTGECDLLDKSRFYEMKPINYFRHLLKYEDQRFAQHSSFRFFALNSILRWNALNDGNIFVKRHSVIANMTADELKKKIQEDPSFIQKLMYQGKNIRGSKAFWKSRQKELTHMIDDLGLPTLFLTLSAADYHWPDLFRILAPDKDVNSLSEKERRLLIQQNPILVDQFFLKRVEAFFENFLIPKFNIKDYWFRVEYQHRGSPNVHGVLWLQDAPDVLNIEQIDSDLATNIANYFGNLVCTEHPNPMQEQAIQHPCRIRLCEVENRDQDLAELVSKVQMHSKCTANYCIRDVNKGCRFGFPKEVCDTTKFIFDEKNHIDLETKRNHPRVNRFNKEILQLWRANIDVAPVVSRERLVTYLSKYITKAETKSKQFDALLNEVMNSSNRQDSAKKIIQRLYIKLSSDRDLSAQEVAHNIMGLKYYSSGKRNFKHLYFNAFDRQNLFCHEEKKSFIDKYHKRNVLPQFSLWQVAKSFELPSGKKINKANIVCTYPKLVFKPNLDENDNFYKYNVILHVPHQDFSDFKKDFVSWKHLYEVHNLRNIGNENDFDTLVRGHQAQNASDENDNFDVLEPNVFSKEEWMNIAAMGPQQITEETNLGEREIDLAFDWNASARKYVHFGSIEEIQTFIVRNKKTSQSSSHHALDVEVQFNNEQLKVLELVDKQSSELLNPNNSQGQKSPKRIIIQGKAGKYCCIVGSVGSRYQCES
ncbi:52 kDa repressor of the inhibitor of the protein kinase [Frankliniella fusca]|uniref:52 kDa repressor of the inhibitor of the protein kinase n=1 Tax=Frankliniella fusca TaxID=407009 RepID=A0AAE1I3G4_9NEOP|nr:52 kDa repressor of the inhibitor of the protein kinase [Frankliniella fusca]